MNLFRILALTAISGGLLATVCRSATLADRSPFLPTALSRTKGGAAGVEALELRGVMSGSAGYLFYIYDPVKKHGVWAGSNDTENPFTIVAEDDSEGSLEIRMNDGRRIQLRLRESSKIAGGMDSVSTVAANAAASMPPSPTRPTEVQAAWREEFSRRLAENAASN
jgi:hypothetical protein